MNTKFVEINGNNLEFDILDLDFIQKFEPAEKKFLTDCLGDNTEDDITLMKKQIEAGNAFFDEVWGAGTAANVFEGRRNLGLLFGAYNAITQCAAAQKKDFEVEAKSFTEALHELAD